MDLELQRKSSFGFEAAETDDDGRLKRTGTAVSASAHIITAVLGCGVLSLAWANAQLGWIAGLFVLMIFSVITWYTSCLLADCYRFPGPIVGTRNYTYIGAVRTHLGELQGKLCGIAQYSTLIGVSIGFTITSSISMAAIKRSNCFHKKGHNVGCHTSNNIFVIIFGIIEVILSQIPNFHELTGLSVIASAMSFTYSLIGLGLSIAKLAGGEHGTTSITGTKVGVDVMSSTDKLWNVLTAIGNVAFAYGYSAVLIEIEDTLKSSPPESQAMKKACSMGISAITIFYMLCGVMGYAAFGNEAPGNFLTGFGFYEPFWLIDFANMCIVVHLAGAYRVVCQPVFQLVEGWCSKKWEESGFIRKEHQVGILFCGIFRVNFFRLIWRTAFVIVTCLIAMLFPFFNSVMGLVGALSFWPLTLYFPIEMHISQAKIDRFTFTWTWLKVLAAICLIVSILAAVASTRGIITDVRSFKPFHSIS